MKELELKIMGGLGNQLYQYSAARYIQELSSSKTIVINTRVYDRYRIRNLELDSILHNDEVVFRRSKWTKSSIIIEIFHIYQRIYRSITKKYAKMRCHNIGDMNYILSCVEFNENKLLNISNNKNIYMYGYFVSSIIAKKMRDHLMIEIVAPTVQSESFKSLRKLLIESVSVGVSVRCGKDYSDNGWPVCSKDYYLSGIEIIRKGIQTRCKVFVFADDINKIKSENWFSQQEVYYVENVSVCESFELLRNCKAYVASNSSFSWWGAFLSYNRPCMWINPNKVYPGNSEIVDSYTFCDDMLLLDYQTGKEIIS